jgi:hypothetical protein
MAYWEAVRLAGEGADLAKTYPFHPFDPLNP